MIKLIDIFKVFYYNLFITVLFVSIVLTIIL